MSSFKELGFTITLRKMPKGVTRMLSLCLVIQRVMRVTPRVDLYNKTRVAGGCLRLKKSKFNFFSNIFFLQNFFFPRAIPGP